MTIVYFRVLCNTILTSITETVRGEGPGVGASLDYALKEAMIQLDVDILDFGFFANDWLRTRLFLGTMLSWR